ncbi:hypothetical protein Tco_0479837, partial [Tanacetum coccineum]
RFPKNLLDRVSQLHQPFSLPERLKTDNGMSEPARRSLAD